MKTKITLVAIFLNIICLELFAQPPLVYNKENLGAGFAPPSLPTINQLPVIDPLPDPFMWSDNSGRSTNFSDWERRRNEIKAEIENYEIGTKPNRPDSITASWIPGATPTTGTLRVIVTKNGQILTLNSAVSLPTGSGPFPAVIGMNSLSGSIPADIFTSRNIARITFSHNNVTTYGNPRNTDPYYRLYPDLNIDNTGQYSAWAWGVSRIIDGLELVQSSLPIDLKHIAVTGCSYAGKMALFAGAFDERVALTIAQESGGGGAPAWRVSEFGGDVEKLGATDHNWFKENMFQFSGLNVPKLPHDHHELMAMVAPRALLVTGNTDFFWLSNPSCYVSARAAKEVYKTFGISDRMGFYIDGGHNHCAVPASQRPAIEAFVDKFLLDKTNVNTDTVTVNPYPNLNYQRWYSWWGTGNPVFPDEGSSVKIWLETECGTVGSNWDIITDATASKGKYITIKSGLNSTGSAPANIPENQVVIPFTIDVAGTYNFLGRAIGPTANDDSYWVRVDNGAFVSANGLTSTNWQWGRLTIADLSVGQHTLTITYREDGAKLDKILITTSNASIISPEILGPNCGVAPVVTPVSFSLDAGSCGQLGTISATDADDIAYPGSTIFQKWKIVGGTGTGVFAIDAATGKLSIANPTAIDFSKTSYTIMVTVSDGYFTSNVRTVMITIPNKIKICHKGKNVISIGKMDIPDHLAHGDCIGACADGVDKGNPSVARFSAGTEEALTNTIKVYPNPAKGQININLVTNLQNVTKIVVVDLSGRVIVQMNVGKMQTLAIPSGRLKAGTYMIRMLGDKTQSQKIVVL
ncbi:MAG TPA: T9SS type A sorting domain-containing protein [Chitinophagaceae bacterium]|nr:T9SS type A sorting domain-containing protein [Chitinophagaceae bacterium]